MNILFLSAIAGRKHAGPTYSVPKQIESQKRLDLVYWVNFVAVEDAAMFDENLYHYCTPKNFKLSELPDPFSCPDVVVFEEFFKMEFVKVLRQIQKANIPYIIVPRCQMTQKYFENKKLKKKIASIVFFSRFAECAKAVQFLSNQELEDSKKFYAGSAFVVANGIELHSIASRHEKKNVVGTFIGRYSVWQKGLDLLVKAVAAKHNELLEANIKLELYGPESPSGSASDVIKLVEDNGVGDVVHVNGPVFGKEKESVLLNTDFFVHTSRFEGMPMSVLEALAYGLPCLVTRGSNLREEIEAYNAGWGCDDSVESIIMGIDAMLKDVNQFSDLSQNANQLAKQYSWMSIAEKTHEMIASFIEE